MHTFIDTFLKSTFYQIFFHLEIYCFLDCIASESEMQSDWHEEAQHSSSYLNFILE